MRSERIADDDAQTILRRMKRWSQGDYNARQGVNGIVTVYNTKYANTAEEARDIVKDMRTLVGLSLV
ncbi:hypothetical protein K461DRAFT_276793 [Myriangium duriaei CBS 260.36]|uniref:Uncharacterized protein n=1 Tax=Myriangium duriaei CBS 260.36 TaxID=1168546 RepID=A0A9P4MI00_9PEZI|nr:hypothetical protein K461DRAFT_276793 [Myriangium duriaei CBS 260.36]